MKTVFTAEAKTQLQAIVAYLETEWLVRVRNRFLQQLRQSVKTMEQYPMAYPASEKFFEARRCVVSSQVSLFYRIESDPIIILTLMDNRQDF